MIEISITQCPLSEVASKLEALLEERHIGGKVFIVHDSNVKSVVDRLGINADGVLSIEATEENKSFETVMQINRWLMDKGANRDSFVLGVGGGITTDMTGFAASIYKRGVKFAFLPTTLLAQVDAAIGGKNGVNLDSYKNMMGIIRQPETTFICQEVLETLPYSQILSGAAELLKTFIIDNEGGFYQQAVQVLSTKSGEFQPLIAAAAQIKAGVAGRDPNEHGERRFLNLGHTFAHAIEKNSEERIGHGEAVSIGIVLAARLAEAIAAKDPSFTVEKGLADRIEADFKACGMQTECPYSVESMAAAMSKDKKAQGSIVHFVLPLSIGHVCTREMTVEEVVDLL